ncbi:YkvA family protein [Vicingaceae bacterium]|nr:YkvA family protein [Vicingaceae bacterium]
MKEENKEPNGFAKAKQKTEELLENGEKLSKLLGVAKVKAEEKKEKLKDSWSDLQSLLRLVQAWWKKDYQEIPWKTILYAATAIFYFVSPLDFIPDFIPITGFLDDITVITFVTSSLKTDIDKFKTWESLPKDEK